VAAGAPLDLAMTAMAAMLEQAPAKR